MTWGFGDMESLVVIVFGALLFLEMLRWNMVWP